jgi:type I restriction enzyme M protein
LPLLKKYSLKEHDLLVNQDGHFTQFKDELNDKGKIKEFIQNYKGVKSAETKIKDALNAYWEDLKKGIVEVTKKLSIADFKRRYAEKIGEALIPLNILDKYQALGVFANWLEYTYIVHEKEDKDEEDETIDVQNVLRTLDAEGFVKAVVSERRIGEKYFADELKQCDTFKKTTEAKQSALETYAFAIEIDGDDEESGDDENEEKQEKKRTVKDVKAWLKKQKDDDSIDADTKSEAAKHLVKIKELEDAVKAARKDEKKARDELDIKIFTKLENLTVEECKDILFDILHDALFEELEAYLKAKRDEAVQAVCHLWDKYAVSARELLAERGKAEKELDGFLVKLGYLRKSAKSADAEGNND